MCLPLVLVWHELTHLRTHDTHRDYECAGVDVCAVGTCVEGCCVYTAAEQCLTQSHGSLGRLPSAQGAVYQLLPHDVSAALGGLGDALVSPSVSIANDDYRSKVSGEANTDRA